MKSTDIFSGLALLVLATSAQAQQTPTREQVEAMVTSSWPNVAPELKSRIDQDKAMIECSKHRNDPPKAIADALVAEAKASVVYPADGRFMGDWKAGEKGALSGYGFRMGDNPKLEAGGNCYACHQLSVREISYGTLGPSLLGYGKLKGNTAQAQKETYEKIYNAQVVLACSNMPRLGHNKVITPEQIKNYVSFLLDPASPVNAEK